VTTNIAKKSASSLSIDDSTADASTTIEDSTTETVNDSMIEAASVTTNKFNNKFKFFNNASSSSSGSQSVSDDIMIRRRHSPLVCVKDASSLPAQNDTRSLSAQDEGEY